MCQASVAFSIMVAGVKMATASLPALEIVFFRSLFGTVMMFLLMTKRKVSFLGRPEDRKLLLLRGVSGFIALSLHFYTLAVLPVGTAVILNYTGPMFVAILAMFFLGEKPGIFLISMVTISFFGLYLLIRPEVRIDPTQGAAIALAIFSGLFAAVAVTSIRSIRRRESPLTIIFAFTAVSTLGSILYLPFGFRWPHLGGWIALAAVALGSFYGQLWMTIAYRRAPASLVAPFAYLTPLLSFLYGLVLWNERFTLHKLMGALLVIVAGITISVIEARRGKKTTFETA